MRTLLLLVLCMLIAGCPANVRPIVVSGNTGINCGPSPKVPPIKMLPVKPWVIKDAQGRTWVGLSPKDYANLSNNMAAIDAHIRVRAAVERFYKDCIQAHNKNN